LYFEFWRNYTFGDKPVFEAPRTAAAAIDRLSADKMQMFLTELTSKIDNKFSDKLFDIAVGLCWHLCHTPKAQNKELLSSLDWIINKVAQNLGCAQTLAKTESEVKFDILAKELRAQIMFGHGRFRP
jgi:lipopolysaccharide biosynthesis protein